MRSKLALGAISLNAHAAADCRTDIVTDIAKSGKGRKEFSNCLGRRLYHQLHACSPSRPLSMLSEYARGSPLSPPDRKRRNKSDYDLSGFGIPAFIPTKKCPLQMSCACVALTHDWPTASQMAEVIRIRKPLPTQHRPPPVRSPVVVSSESILPAIMLVKTSALSLSPPLSRIRIAMRDRAKTAALAPRPLARSRSLNAF